MIAIGISSVTFGQTKMSENSKVEAQIITLEKADWEVWENKHTAWHQNTVTEGFLFINSEKRQDRRFAIRGRKIRRSKSSVGNLTGAQAFPIATIVCFKREQASVF